jgi:23S rRNA (uridine2552-2'-O)-methyltransferase
VSRLHDRRQRHDTFYRRAKRESYAARSVYKLREIDERFKLLRPGARVLDLGCRPGSWLQYASERVGATGAVVGIDRTPLEIALPANARALVGDVIEVQPETLLEALPEGAARCFQIVLSDMAPDTSGVPFTDQVRSVELVERALELSQLVGCPGSALVAKIFMGEGFEQAVRCLKQRFEVARTVRPDATRKSSTEVYLVGTARRA